jgi:2-polyprenyl-6-methoxyphenol hydroxylase-like FAD-dependent oxidoreductase
VQPNATRVLHKLGIGIAVNHAGAIVRRWQFRAQQGEVLCDIELEPLWGDADSFIGIERTKLHDALKSCAVSCRLGTWVRSLSQDGHGVSVVFNDGTTGKYDLVVGADGIHSATRELVLGMTPPTYGGQMVWRSLAPIRPQELDCVQFWLGDGCFFGMCPVKDGTYGFANVTQARRYDTVKGRIDQLRRCFSTFSAPVRDYLAALECDEQIHCAPIEWLDVEQWHCGRVVLIGDAAHASSPMMGQGGSMAMEDALVLAEILHATPELETAIDRFIARRMPRVNWVQQQSRALGEMFRMPPGPRNAALREHGKSAFYERFQPLVALP